jgi:MFS family permease
LLGEGATNVPLIIYISRWFDCRRGSAVALISCGQYIAGILWPPLIALGIEHLGWRPTMLAFGVASGVCMVLSVLIFLRPVPESILAFDDGDAHRVPALRMSPRIVFVLLCIAGFLCCTPMAMPPAHLVALCSDLGIAPAHGGSLYGSSPTCGMALGGWFAGAMYDQLGSYAPAFVAGVGFNLGNIALIGWLATRIR